ncbi:MAG: lytic transglycosylase, partial [Synechococcaceae bacterium WB9_2_112]|nr:lytic transglycosylase [Synechococcaceae bacterium WB9_2_112]
RLACAQQPRPPAKQRAQIASGLAEIGMAKAAIRCLEGPEPAWAELADGPRLSLARTLLKGDAAQRQRGIDLLLELGSRQGGNAADAPEAVRLLAQQEGAAAAAALSALPALWRDSAPVAARRVLADPAGQGGLAVLQRWPEDPASWDLQWELARSELLAGRWSQAERLLRAIDPARLPPLLAARQRFWLGFSQLKQGQAGAAADSWRELLRHHPGGCVRDQQSYGTCCGY